MADGNRAINETLTTDQRETLLNTLKARFEKNTSRHSGLAWPDVLARLEAEPGKLLPLFAMERTGGEPDVTGYDTIANTYIFTDCTAESPAGRRSLCYDREALDARKENKPAGSVLGMAAEMGAELLDEQAYRDLQKLGTFDAKTSSWILTPPDIRKLGGALFADWRYGHVFVYHNSADSYYAARGFRCLLRV